MPNRAVAELVSVFVSKVRPYFEVLLESDRFRTRLNQIRSSSERGIQSINQACADHQPVTTSESTTHSHHESNLKCELCSAQNFHTPAEYQEHVDDCIDSVFSVSSDLFESVSESSGLPPAQYLDPKNSNDSVDRTCTKTRASMTDAPSTPVSLDGATESVFKFKHTKDAHLQRKYMVVPDYKGLPLARIKKYLLDLGLPATGDREVGFFH